ncbi:vomeronasal type-1 receptor 4-like [Suricata suricatta]|uniref:vomeronasal type-1 receptor 4-like n=1 Tax=Suricata suricatta TaxID=37032 RepID=UPI001155B790|nr:vomeronasal type-1 receptor 4-like [Suricata suricatta]
MEGSAAPIPTWLGTWLLHIISLKEETQRRKRRQRTGSPRVARGVSIESTCLLSVFQAITISPQNSRWAALKGTAARHKQRVRYIHAASVSPRPCAGSRATRSILVLVSTCVFCHAVSSVCQVCQVLLNNPSQSLVTTSALFFAVCFPTLSPFVLTSRDPRVFRPSFAWVRNKKTPSS